VSHDAALAVKKNNKKQAIRAVSRETIVPNTARHDDLPFLVDYFRALSYTRRHSGSGQIAGQQSYQRTLLDGYVARDGILQLWISLFAEPLHRCRPTAAQQPAKGTGVTTTEEYAFRESVFRGL
jgi:hypothetical protein